MSVRRYHTRLVEHIRPAASLSAWIHALRLLRYHYVNHVQQVRKLEHRQDLRISPLADFRNAERIAIGAGTRVGEYAMLWAGDSTGTITIGCNSLIAPRVYVTASDYGLDEGVPLHRQRKFEKNVVVGDDVWLGAQCVVVSGVTIGSGAVVAAGAVVTKNVDENSIVGGVPAKVIGRRRVGDGPS